MSNTTEMIIQFFKMYGWQLTVLATSGIVFLGILKAFGTFNKVNTKAKKYLYYGISNILSIVACTAYIFITDVFEWRAYLILIGGIIGFTSAIYTLYENTGARDLLKKCLYQPTKNLFSKIWNAILKGTLKKETVIKMASEYGEDVANEIVVKAHEVQEEKIAEEKAKEEEKKAKEEAKAEKKAKDSKTEEVEVIEETKVDVQPQKIRVVGRQGIKTIETPKRK